MGLLPQRLLLPAYTCIPCPKGCHHWRRCRAYFLWHCLHRLDVAFVAAAGGNRIGAGRGRRVGLAAVEIAAQVGADVIGVCKHTGKREAAMARGARAALEPGPELATQVKTLTAGRGADVIVDPVGRRAICYAVRAAAHNAQLLSIGFASGSMPAVQPNLLLVKNLTLHGFFYGRYIGWTPADERAVHAPALQRAMRTLLSWARNGRIRPEVSKVYPMNGLPDALAALHGRHVIGKLALSIKQETTT